jgi:hypothetical protein
MYKAIALALVLTLASATFKDTHTVLAEID